MLTLLLAEAELELVPKEVLNHPCAVAYAKKRGKKGSNILLDSTIHHPALKKLEDGWRRGRPDIVHFFLLISLDSILNYEGKLAIVVHTRENKLIKIDRGTKLPKNYMRFIGLIEQLYQNKYVPNKETPLLRIENNRTIGDIIRKLKGRKILFSEKGRNENLCEYFKKYDDVVCIIGGFPEGNFKANLDNLIDDKISLSTHPFPSWTIASEVIVSYRLSKITSPS
ncbi:MAG: 16S rRNA methyltransferase [Candidatus Thermoplasmatota archaeon]